MSKKWQTDAKLKKKGSSSDAPDRQATSETHALSQASQKIESYKQSEAALQKAVAIAEAAETALDGSRWVDRILEHTRLSFVSPSMPAPTSLVLDAASERGGSI